MERCRTTPEVYGFEVVLKQAIFLSCRNPSSFYYSSEKDIARLKKL
jgi:hypothetical protein